MSKTKLKNTILAIITSIVAIFVPAIIFNKIFEGVFFFICHWLIREQFEKQYHHIIPATCRLITSVVFFFGVSFILPFAISLFSAIPINYFIGWVGFTKKQADDLEVENMKLKSKLQETNKIPELLDVANCTEEVIIQRCKEFHLTKYAAEMAINIFVRKLTTKQLSEMYSINKRSVTIQKARLKTL